MQAKDAASKGQRQENESNRKRQLVHKTPNGRIPGCILLRSYWRSTSILLQCYSGPTCVLLGSCNGESAQNCEIRHNTSPADEGNISTKYSKLPCTTSAGKPKSCGPRHLASRSHVAIGSSQTGYVTPTTFEGTPNSCRVLAAKALSAWTCNDGAVIGTVATQREGVACCSVFLPRADRFESAVDHLLSPFRRPCRMRKYLVRFGIYPRWRDLRPSSGVSAANRRYLESKADRPI
jgi:hypothetical protein